MASALHPVAARAYTEQHYDSTIGFLKNIAVRPTEFSRCLNNAVGGFVMQMVYDHKVVEGDPLIKLLLENTMFAVESMLKHYWVNDLPFRKCQNI
jgi:hypothetical protein